jgi:hypothetical protein
MQQQALFDSIGGREFLREVRTDEYHYRLVESNQEKEMEMQGKISNSHSIPLLAHERSRR